MRKTVLGFVIVMCSIAVAGAASKKQTIKTKNISREISVDSGRLTTTEITNLMMSKNLQLKESPEFRLRISQGTHIEGTDITLTSADFAVTKVKKHRGGVTVSLIDKKHALSVEVHYTADSKAGVLRKYLVITSDKDITLERIDVEMLTVPEAYQPYTKDALTANAPGNWSPNLGQPLYTKNSGMFFGLEFPASRNLVVDGNMQAGYLRGRTLKAGKPYTTYSAVAGASDDPEFVADAFQHYINGIRCRPFRLQTQYNSWFDYGQSVSKEKFIKSVNKISRELVTERGTKPLTRYVIDDGWQDTGADWSDKVWKVNGKFDADFKTCTTATAAVGSEPGLWLSPGCLFGASRQVPKLRAKGFEALDNWMSMAGPRYMQALEDRMVELTRNGVSFFKMDGVFGHLNLRNFELHGDRYGIPYMPQLNTDGLKSGSKELNDSKYNELKLYYMTAGTERLMAMFKKLAEVNPDIYLLISNGAYLSPWWLMHVDAVWMINAGDAAGGSSRTKELVYRDGRYYKLFAKEHTQYPLNALFNHEPKKTKTGEPAEIFRKYLYMSLSRGTGFVELYIKPFKLSAKDWDVLSEGLHWVDENSELFVYARMHGGDPAKDEVYGYSGWNTKRGYVSIHNPSENPVVYKLTLDRKLGVEGTGQKLYLSSPMADSVADLPPQIKAGETISINLKAGEIRLIHFDRKVRDWPELRELPAKITQHKEEKGISLKGSLFVGVWQYTHKGTAYTRSFEEAGICTLFEGTKIRWRRSVIKAEKNKVVLDGDLVHTLNQDGTLNVEGNYIAVRKK